MRVDREKARILRQQGMKYEDIAKELGCSINWCRKYLRDIPKGVREKKEVLYEVYIAYSTDGLLYIGSGKHGRNLHCKSGNSSSKELNRLVHNKIDFIVEVVVENLSKEDSLNLEQYLILDLSPKFNKRLLVTNNTKINKGVV